jgi:predicted DNA-binding transcriptional regulator YafY
MPRTPAAKLHRWLDLIVCLLSRRLPLTFEEIQREVAGYRKGNRDALKRTFERDKDELRRFGINIETVGDDGAADAAYRLSPRDFYMPYLALASERGVARQTHVPHRPYQGLDVLVFEADDLDVVAAAAARATQLGDERLSLDAESAMRKLAFDLPIDAALAASDTHIVAPRASTTPRILAELYKALTGRKRAEIEYHSMSSGSTTTRTVEPYGLCFLSGHWYLVARTTSDGTVRNFRANRVRNVKVNTKREGTADYDVPRAFNLREHAQVREAWELGDGDTIEALVEFTPVSGSARGALTLGAAVEGQPYQRTFRVRRRDVFARWLLSFAGDAVPLQPENIVSEFHALARATRAMYAGSGEPTTALNQHAE